MTAVAPRAMITSAKVQYMPGIPGGLCNATGKGTVMLSCQRFRPKSGERFTWTNTAVGDGQTLGSGEVTADQWGLVTLKQLTILKSANRIAIKRK